MPRYDYKCGDCGHVFELRQSFDADPVGVCPRCEGESKRKFHVVPIIYKGSGFYTTDYKNAGNSGTVKTKQKDESEEAPKEKDKTAKASKDSKDSKDSSEDKVSATKES